MLSYKDWKIVNESVAGGALGLGQVQSLGLVGSNTMTEEEMLAEMRKRLNEAKKKMKKKMGFGRGSEEIAPEGEGDGEVVPPREKKDADPDADEKARGDSEDSDDDEDGDEHDEEHDEEHDDDHDDDDHNKSDMDIKNKVKRDMDDEENPDMPEKRVSDDVGDARELMMKKKMKKGGDKKCEKCHKDPCVCKKEDKKEDKKDKKEDKKKKLTKEQSEWLSSVKSMLNNDSIALSGLPEPTAGQYGFTPVQYMGMK